MSLFILTVKKAWDWLKRHWQWVVFPVGLGALLLSILVGASRRKTPPTADLAPAGEEAVEAILAATETRDQKLAELEEAHRERLVELSKDQRKELQELREKELEEVVAWFDKL